MDAIAIRLENISMQYGTNLVLQDIDLTVSEGEFVTVVGPSGCGKTTLLKVVAGLIKPTAGSVEVLNNPPHTACKNQQIGVAFQRPALVPSRTAVENVRLTLEIAKRANCMSPETILSDFGLDEGSFLKYPHQLSGGMRQRVDLACAVAHNPAILLLDEPFGPLDEITRESMGTWLSQVLIGRTVLFITHSVEEAVVLSDRVVVLSECPGNIVGTVKIRLPRPRSRLTEPFQRKATRVRELLYSTISKNGGDK